MTLPSLLPSRAVLALLGVALLAGESSAAPSKLEGMAYGEARKVILGYGWKPWSGPCPQGKRACARYPEIDACSISFPSKCAMRFSRGDRCLIVGTSGEGPPGNEDGDPIVESVHFRKGSCSWSEGPG